MLEATTIPTNRHVCCIDGSWHAKQSRSGHGWIVSCDGKLMHMGLKGSPRSLSPLHTELESLLWTMKCLVAIPMTSILILTDCSDLIKMTLNPEEWSAFSTELRDFEYFRDLFSTFSIKHIPRSKNTAADHLAKCARVRG